LQFGYDMKELSPSFRVQFCSTQQNDVHRTYSRGIVNIFDFSWMMMMSHISEVQ